MRIEKALDFLSLGIALACKYAMYGFRRAALVAALLLPTTVSAATVVVTNLGDAAGSCPGAFCTLRAALAAANFGDTIVFDPGLTLPATIALVSSELTIYANQVTLIGPGASRLTVQAAAGRRVASIVGKIEISGLTLAGGTQIGTNGATGGIGGVGQSGGFTEGGCLRVNSLAQLILRDSAVHGCQALAGEGGTGGISLADGDNTIDAGPGGAGGDAHGGAIAVYGDLQMIGSSVSGSLARGGRGGNGGEGGEGTGFAPPNGGQGGSGGAARGGALYVAIGGVLLLRNSTLTGNSLVGGDGGNGGIAFEGDGGNGGAGGIGEGGALFNTNFSFLTVVVDVVYATLGPSVMTAGAGGAGGIGGAGVIGGQNGSNGLLGMIRGEAFAFEAVFTNAARLRSSVATGTSNASDCHGGYSISGSNFGGDGGCTGFTHSGNHAANFVHGQSAGRSEVRPIAVSVVIDTAPDCNDANGVAVTTDQYGQSRPFDGDATGGAKCDLGAIEYRPPLIFLDGFES